MTNSNSYLQNRVIIVTGAASGFGRLVCEKSAAKGARVLCADVNETGVKETVAAITELGGTAEALSLIHI